MGTIAKKDDLFKAYDDVPENRKNKLQLSK